MIMVKTCANISPSQNRDYRTPWYVNLVLEMTTNPRYSPCLLYFVIAHNEMGSASLNSRATAVLPHLAKRGGRMNETPAVEVKTPNPGPVILTGAWKARPHFWSANSVWHVAK